MTLLRAISFTPPIANRLAVLLVVLSMLFPATPVFAREDTPLKLVITPDKAQTGKSRGLTISGDKGQSLEDYQVQPLPPGSGLTLTQIQHTDQNKKITLTITVDKDADLGVVPITLTKDAREGEAEDSVSVNIEVTEFVPRRINRGPTPDDINQVDAMWTVLPFNVTYSNFGRRAAKHFYAIQLYIGNNSGYDLQIVGVGFNSALGRRIEPAFDNGRPIVDSQNVQLGYLLNEKGERIRDSNTKKEILAPLTYPLPTSDHRLVRGSIEMDQLYGARALTLNIIGGFGTLVSGFVPFFRRPSAKANFSTISSIINGQLKEGFAIAAPDTTVSQLNHLENLALHDGLTVQNNSQAKTIVFVPRDIIYLSPEEKKQMDDGRTLYPVMDKLGTLIIVGKPFIAFNSREIVATRPDSTPPTPQGGQNLLPTVANVLANNGNAPGSNVLITGSNFTNVTDVQFGGVRAKKFTVLTSTQLSAVVPDEALTGQITVTTTNGTATSGRFTAQPIITEFTLGSEANNNVPGKTVTVKGINLDGATTVDFGGQKGEVVGTPSSTQIIAKIPERALTGRITVATPGGTATSTTEFTAPPLVSSFSPSKAGAGETIRIIGLNLANATDVKIENVSAKINNKTSNELTVEIPPNATKAKIQVITTGGSAMSNDTFEFVAPPTISGLSVISGPVGSIITISGTNLSELMEVKFGAMRAESLTDKTPTSFKVTVPVGATTGPITIKTHGGTATSGTFTVTSQ